MASARSKGTLPVGSAQWVQNEREQAVQLIDQDVEEFSYSARNEVEWLNEHMAEVLSRNQLNFTELLKTPGKLRGKTPRTARKRDPLEARAPLTDLFAPNPQAFPSPAPKTAFYDKVAQFQIAEDAKSPQRPQSASRRSPQRTGMPNGDSGYQGLTDDEVDARARSYSTRITDDHGYETQTTNMSIQAQDSDALANDDSFVSANEGFASKNAPRESLNSGNQPAVPEDKMDVAEAEIDELTPTGPDAAHDLPEEMAQDGEVDDASEASSPEKPLQRKSSLNFASLPPRETLTAKRSLGPRGSYFDAQLGRSSVAGRSMGGKSFDNSVHSHADQEVEEEDEEEEKEPESANNAVTAEHNKSSTQRLHDRINLLGQSKDPRSSKSIPNLAVHAAPIYPQLPKEGADQKAASNVEPKVNTSGHDDDDDWIAPIEKSNSTSNSATRLSDKPTDGQVPTTDRAANSVQSRLGSPTRPAVGYQKSISTTNIASPTKASMAPDAPHKMALSVSNPNLSQAMALMQAATPIGSPTGKRFQDGPLSASKSRLYSVLKSAKSMFASSAGASAQAKMEAASPVRPKQHEPVDIRPEMLRMPGGLYEDLPMAPKPAERPAQTTQSPAKEGRKTRSSTESEKKREKDAREKRVAQDGLDKAREQERQRAAEQVQDREQLNAARQEQERLEAASRAEEQDLTDDMPPAPATKSMLPAGKLRAPARPVRPATKQASQQAKPAPVSIRVASQSQRLGSAQPPTSMPSSATHEPTPPPAATRQQAAVTRAGSVPLGGKTAAPASNARLRALEAAARKKEQDDKAAQRKVEQKRELERKRAAKVEDDRRAEQERKAVEQQRAQEAKLVAQKQAEQRKQEQQQREAAAQKAKTDAELAAALERERVQAGPPHPRGDVQGTLRQLGKTNMIQDTQSNAAKPTKRQHDPEEEQPARPGLQRGPPSYHQQDAKRRKTNEEDDVEMKERPLVMAPPKRPSNMRKETLTKFPHGYAHASASTTHLNQTMFKSTLAAQHQLQQGPKVAAPTHPNDMLKLSTARIPFAESSNHAPNHYVPHAPSSSSAPNAFRTPGRPAAPGGQIPKMAKSSPAYPNGENIALPEIATDSEDSDSDDDDDNDDKTAGFRAPSWVASPALRELLTQQQLVDPESVFGPIAPLHMEEVFKNGKNAGERLKRFRDRGSSARWVESGDALSQEERVREAQGRARIVRNGGWTFEVEK